MRWQPAGGARRALSGSGSGPALPHAPRARARPPAGLNPLLAPGSSHTCPGPRSAMPARRLCPLAGVLLLGLGLLLLGVPEATGECREPGVRRQSLEPGCGVCVCKRGGADLSPAGQAGACSSPGARRADSGGGSGGDPSRISSWSLLGCGIQSSRTGETTEEWNFAGGGSVPKVKMGDLLGDHCLDISTSKKHRWGVPEG